MLNENIPLTSISLMLAVASFAQLLKCCDSSCKNCFNQLQFLNTFMTLKRRLAYFSLCDICGGGKVTSASFFFFPDSKKPSEAAWRDLKTRLLLVCASRQTPFISAVSCSLLVYQVWWLVAKAQSAPADSLEF